jgi:hypothetical protein
MKKGMNDLRTISMPGKIGANHVPDASHSDLGDMRDDYFISSFIMLIYRQQMDLYAVCFMLIYRMFQKELYNVESSHKFIQCFELS